MPLLVSILSVLISLVFLVSPTSAAQTCPTNSTCQVDGLGPNCTLIAQGCIINQNQNGSFCCGGVSQSTPTPTTSSNPNSCIANGNYCVPAAIECEDGHVPGQGGSCTNGRICCQRNPVTPTPLIVPPSSPILPKSPETEGFEFLEYPCDDTVDPEFHPLRPYPGSPCDRQIPKSWPENENITFACGKSLNTEATFELPKRVVPVGIKPTNPVAGQYYWCDASRTQVCTVRQLDFDVRIDLGNSSIPILGNTEIPLDDATKVNQYLLWYLAGTVQQSEQVPLDPSKSADISRLINFSGPLKKLLPFDIQNWTKSKTTNSSVGTQYHNYIIGCQKNIDLAHVKNLIVSNITTILSNVSNAFELAQVLVSLPVEQFFSLINLVADLYGQNLSVPEIAMAIRNSGLLGNNLRVINAFLSFEREAFENLRQQINTISLDAAESCSTSTNEKRLRDMANNLPPDPRDSKYENDFDKYWNDYLVWRGYWNLPIFGPQDFRGVPSLWAQLFANVPFSTLEDTMSEFTVSVIDDPRHQPEGVITQNPSRPIRLTISPDSDARVSVPHVRALTALSKMLQSLFSPRPYTLDPNVSVTAHQSVGDGPSEPTPPVLTSIVGGENNSSVVPGQEAPFPLFTSHDSRCDLKDVRINAGDDLYGQQINANLSYYQEFRYTPEATSASCLEEGSDCDPAGGACCSGNCNLRAEGRPDLGYYCAGSGGTEVASGGRVAVFTKTPLTDRIYQTLISGPMSVFRRFIPRKPEGITDELYIRRGGSAIPAAADATYSLIGSNTSDAKVTAGDGSGGGQVYFSQLGSLFDYFLGAAKENMNLQKLLRPQGIGGGGDAGLVGTTTGSCTVPTDGLCAPNNPITNLSQHFGAQAGNASAICFRESTGVATSINDACLANPVYNKSGKQTADYSVGLFQINLLAKPNPAYLREDPNGQRLAAAIADIGHAGKSCYEAFSNWKEYQTNLSATCRIGNQELLDLCVEWFQEPANNVAFTKWQTLNGQDWSDWSTSAACNIE